MAIFFLSNIANYKNNLFYITKERNIKNGNYKFTTKHGK